MRPRMITPAAAALLAAAALSACGAGAGGAGTGSGPHTVNAVLENQPWTRALLPYIPQFEKQTGITVNVQEYSEEQSRNKILITLQSKSPGMDVFMSLPSLEGKEYEHAGYYQPLSSYVSNPKQTPSSYRFSDFSQPTVNAETIGGNLTGIPINVETPVIYYRTDLFSRYRIPVPATQAALLAAANTLKAHGGGTTYPIAGRGLDTAVDYTFAPFFHDQGLQWLTPSGKPNFNTQAAVNAISYYAALVGKDGPPGVENNNFTQSSALFAEGRAAMELDSTNEISAITDPASSHVAGNTGVFPVPPGPGGSHPTLLNWGLSMSKYSAHKDAAWKFIQWATSPQMQLKLALKGIASPRLSVSASRQYQATVTSPLRQEWQHALDAAVATGNTEVGPPAVNQPVVRKVIGDAIDKVMLGQESAAAAAAEIQKGLAPAVSGGGS